MAHTTESVPLVRAMYHDDDVLISAVKQIRAAGFKISEVYTPFPVHGLDKAMGLKESRIAVAAFMYGVIGLTVAVTLTWYMMVSDWPQNIGGKPNINWAMNMPAFVPILFEMTVFFCRALNGLDLLSHQWLIPRCRRQESGPPHHRRLLYGRATGG